MGAFVKGGHWVFVSALVGGALAFACNAEQSSGEGAGGSAGEGTGASGGTDSDGSSSGGSGGDIIQIVANSSNTSTSGITPIECTPGGSCACGGDASGEIECNNGVATCVCDECGELPAPEPADFDACGGEPFGTWVLSEISPGDVTTLVHRNLGDTTGDYCPAEVTALGDDISFRLVLADGGDMAFELSGLSYSLQLLESCVAEARISSGCDQVLLDREIGVDPVGTCSANCDICSCNILREGSFEGTWERSDTTLDLSYVGFDHEYCVEGNQMRLRNEDGLVLVMQRVFPFSDPTPCEERSVEQCIQGCRVGQCLGDADCESASSEGDCTNQQGCEWDAESCTGSPRDCSLADYDVVPGCEFLDEEPSCAGARVACEEVAIEECDAAPGCGVEGGCVGGTVTCSVLTGACDFCNNVDGCGDCPDGGGACAGSSTCEQQPSSFACEDATNYGMGDCEWIDSLCRGEATPCEDLPAEVCDDVTGCNLQ